MGVEKRLTGPFSCWTWEVWRLSAWRSGGSAWLSSRAPDRSALGILRRLSGAWMHSREQKWEAWWCWTSIQCSRSHRMRWMQCPKQWCCPITRSIWPCWVFDWSRSRSSSQTVGLYPLATRSLAPYICRTCCHRCPWFWRGSRDRNGRCRRSSLRSGGEH